MRLTRRSVGTAVVSGAVAALAGCTDGDSGGTDETDAESATVADEETTEVETETPTETADGTTDDGTTDATTGSADVSGTVVASDNTDGLEITEHEFYRDGTAVGVRGVVENVGEQTFTYVEVTASPVSDEEESLGMHYATLEQATADRLEPGATFEFDVVFEDTEPEQVSGYRVWVTGQTDGNTETGTGTESA